MDLPEEHFDVAYSHEVLLHNEQVNPIIENVLSSLRPEGVYYFNTVVEQGDEVEDAIDALSRKQWKLETRKLTHTFANGTRSRLVHKVTRNKRKSSKFVH